MTTLSVTVDGVSLSTLAYDIETSASRRSLAGGRASDAVLPGANGVIPGRMTSEPRDLALTLWVIGADSQGNVSPDKDVALAQYEANMDTLLGLFGSRHRLQTIDMVMGDGSTRRAMGRVVEAFPAKEDLQGAVPQCRLTVIFEMPEVFWRSTGNTSFTQALSGSGGTYWMPAFEGSTAPMEDLTVTVAGPITNPKVECPSTGAWISYAGSVPAGQSWVINCATWATTVGGVNAVSKVSSGGYGPRWLTFAPERNGNAWGVRVKVSGSGMGTGTAVTVQGRRAFQ